MQVSNVAYNTLNTGFSANKASNVYKNNFSPRLLNQADTVSFGRRKKEEGEEESSKKAKKECKGYTLPQAFAMLLAASITFPHFATCLVNHASDARNQYELQNAFKNNPKSVAMEFVESFASGSGAIGTGSMHFEYSEDSTDKFYGAKKSSGSMLGPNSVVGFDFTNGVFSSASLDIDGDKHPEITVTTDEDGKLVISYDYDSDGTVDTIETLAKEGEE